MEDMDAEITRPQSGNEDYTLIKKLSIEEKQDSHDEEMSDEKEDETLSPKLCDSNGKK